MASRKPRNPLIDPIVASFAVKRNKSGLVPRNWLLIILVIIDQIAESDRGLEEDDIYTYDYTLKRSRSVAIPKLLKKYGLPVNLGLSHEGVTVRGAPGLRVFRAIDGGKSIAGRSRKEKSALILEAVELVRTELLRVVGQTPVLLPSFMFDDSGTFVAALLESVENRSNGRVEQALAGAKLQLRFPEEKIPRLATFAADRQTRRDCDYAVGNQRFIVSVSPNDNHFNSAISLAKQQHEVFLIVNEKSVARSKKRIKDEGLVGRVRVVSVEDYVPSNMSEIAFDRGFTSRKMCLELLQEYNHRIRADNDVSLSVFPPPDNA